MGADRGLRKRGWPSTLPGRRWAPPACALCYGGPRDTPSTRGARVRAAPGAPRALSAGVQNRLGACFSEPLGRSAPGPPAARSGCCSGPCGTLMCARDPRGAREPRGPRAGRETGRIFTNQGSTHPTRRRLPGPEVLWTQKMIGRPGWREGQGK